MKKRLYILLLGLVAGITSCTDWLDVQPKTSIPVEKLFESEAGFKDVLTGFYLKMGQTNLYAKNLTYGYLDAIAGNYDEFPGVMRWREIYDYDNTWSSVKDGVYTSMYNVIANINNFLKYIDKNRSVIKTEKYYELMKGEALGLRAFLHFDLLRMFGPIYKDNPTAKRIAYRTEFNQEPKEMQPSNVVVDSIIADLKRAEILLTNIDPLNFEFPKTEDGNSGTGKDGFLEYRHKRMNLYAVKAMLARVYLYAGNKTEAVNYANQVIDGKYFDLIGDATDVLRSKEIVFSVYVDKFDQQVTDITNGTSYLIVKESFLNEMFDVANDGTNDLRIREGVGFDYGTNGIKMRKYKQENLWASTEGTVVLIRLSEMYYILAECAATPGEAAEFLNKVRNIRGVDPVVCTEANRLDEIEKEYRKEFYGEGQLFFFYKRHAYTTFLHCPVNQMAESNYMFSWPDNETLFGKTN